MKKILEHVRVLDLSRVFAGPWATQMLADFGADVIKVEHIKGGDDVRRMGVAHLNSDGSKSGETSSFFAMNRGKRSIAIDLKTDEGQKIVRDLALESDIFVENFKTGNLARFGLDYKTLKAINPKLIYCSITGFGQDGPRSHLPGYDPIFQAMSGVMSVTGVPENEPGSGPNMVGYSISDINAGYYAVIAILAALNHRDQISGKGQHIDIALLDSQLHATSHMAMNYFSSGKVPIRNGTASQITCPWQSFNASDKEIMIAVGNDAQFVRFITLLGLSDLIDDERFETNLLRVKNSKLLIPMISAVIETHTAQYWEDELEKINVPSGQINNFEQVFEDPQIKHREMKQKLNHDTAGEIDIIANPIRFSDTKISYNRPPPVFAADTDEVLSKVLKIDELELTELRNKKAIF